MNKLNHLETLMKLKVLWITIVFLSIATSVLSADSKSERIATAEEYFRGIYGGDPSVVDRLTSENIVVSYPIIQNVAGTPAIRGRDAVKALVARFGKKWADPHYEFHETVCEGDRVVLLWSFHARSLAETPPGQAKSDDDYSWGGITLIRFDENGKISAEIGEESNPGPYERVHAKKEE